MFKNGIALALAGALAVAGAAAKADLAPVLNTTSGAASPYTWDYSIHFGVGPGADHQLQSGDFVTLYDIVGLDASSVTTPANWTASVQTTGVTAPGTLPTDDPTIDNITWTYTGGVRNADTDFNGFDFKTTSNQVVAGNFTSVDYKATGAVPGNESHIGPAAVPGNVTPEGSSLALLLPAAAPLAVALRRRARRA